MERVFTLTLLLHFSSALAAHAHPPLPSPPAGKAVAAADEPSTEPAAAATTIDLVLLLNSPPDWTELKLTEVIRDAINVEKSVSADLDGIRCVRITKRNYDDLGAIISQNKRGVARPAADDTIAQDPDRSLMWKVVIPPGADAPKSLSIRYQIIGVKDDALHDEEFPLGDVGAEESRFRYFNLGLALFRAEETWDVKEYALNYPGRTAQFKKWPAPPRQFFTQIPDFQGGEAARQRFFDVLERGDVGVVLINDSSVRPVTLMHLDLDPIPPDPRPVTFGRNYRVGFDALSEQPFDASRGVGVQRLWALMPLTTTQKDEVVAKLQEAGSSREKLIALIRGPEHLGYPIWPASKLSERLTPIENLPADWPVPSVLVDELDKPAWFEIPLLTRAGAPPSYARSFQFGPAVKQPSDANWQIIVYEFENPNLAGPNGDKSIYRAKEFNRDGVKRLWLAQRMDGWPIGDLPKKGD